MIGLSLCCTVVARDARLGTVTVGSRRIIPVIVLAEIEKSKAQVIVLYAGKSFYNIKFNNVSLCRILVGSSSQSGTSETRFRRFADQTKLN